MVSHDSWFRLIPALPQFFSTIIGENAIDDPLRGHEALPRPEARPPPACARRFRCSGRPTPTLHGKRFGALTVEAADDFAYRDRSTAWTRLISR
jgi:hypothetical protein